MGLIEHLLALGQARLIPALDKACIRCILDLEFVFETTCLQVECFVLASHCLDVLGDLSKSNRKTKQLQEKEELLFLCITGLW